jgi:hypothetical protein
MDLKKYVKDWLDGNPQKEMQALSKAKQRKTENKWKVFS